MARVKRVSPLRAYKFKVIIPQVNQTDFLKQEIRDGARSDLQEYVERDLDVGFSKISGLGVGENDIMDYRNGDSNMDFHRQPGLMKFRNVIFERGLASEETAEQIMEWRKQIMYHMDDPDLLENEDEADTFFFARDEVDII
jgi:hypothetical protein